MINVLEYAEEPIVYVKEEDKYIYTDYNDYYYFD